MWRVTFQNRGGEASIFWVDGSTAADAEVIARRQAGDLVTADTASIVVHADQLPAEDDISVHVAVPPGQRLGASGAHLAIR